MRVYAHACACTHTLHTHKHTEREIKKAKLFLYYYQTVTHKALKQVTKDPCFTKANNPSGPGSHICTLGLRI